jgi:[ribosomal protein S5]-alanine N-acetyltransferase
VISIPLRTAVVRSWRPADLDSLVANANNRNVWINTSDRFPFPYTRAAGHDWLETACNQSPETNFAIDVDGAAIGGVGFVLQEDVAFRSAEIGYWLGEKFWGRGIATDAVRAVTELAIREHKLCRLYGLLFEWNPASARVLEKASYKLEARLRKSATKAGKTIDQLLYAFVVD